MCGGEDNVSLKGKGIPWLNRPSGLQEIKAAIISIQSEQEGGAVVSLPHRPSSPPSKHAWYSLLLVAESTPEP
jgi:hypothetical protein